MIEDCYKTKFLPAVVHLKTADGSSMSSLGKATLHLRITNFKFSHIFFHMWQATSHRYFIWHRYTEEKLWSSWVLDKQLFTQREGSFLPYTKNCEQQHDIAVVKSPLKIPPRHNDVIPMTIKEHNLKAPIEYLISNQHINRRLDPRIHMIDGIYNIKDRSTFHIHVANYTKKHVTLNKGQCIGHTDPSNHDMPQTSIKSLTTQKMIVEYIQPDTFTPLLILSWVTWGNH